MTAAAVRRVAAARAAATLRAALLDVPSSRTFSTCRRARRDMTVVHAPSSPAGGFPPASLYGVASVPQNSKSNYGLNSRLLAVLRDSYQGTYNFVAGVLPTRADTATSKIKTLSQMGPFCSFLPGTIDRAGMGAAVALALAYSLAASSCPRSIIPIPSANVYRTAKLNGSPLLVAVTMSCGRSWSVKSGTLFVAPPVSKVQARLTTPSRGKAL
eukprot:6334413-Prymnesium_polylepis.1